MVGATTITPWPASVTSTSTESTVIPLYGPLAAVAVWVMATSCSPTTSPSFRARTVTVCAVAQLPESP